MTAVLLRGGQIYSPADPFATAMLVVDGRIAWIGDEGGAHVHVDIADEVIDLAGALVTPAFVDAHVHLTSTGLTLNGLDLSTARSAAECLEALSRSAQPGTILLGHGWDQSAWSDARVPSTADIDRFVGDIPVYLSRVDVHSALVSSALRRLAPHAQQMRGWDSDGPVTREAHHAIREIALASVSVEQRAQAQDTALRVAASRGIACLHENGGPTISSPEDFREVLALGRDPSQPEVVGYWGRLHGQDEAASLGARGAGGDLFVDGSLGSHTACLHQAYADAPSTSGASYITVEEVAEHVSASTAVGQQAGFHVIGDEAISIVVDGFRQAIRRVGLEGIRMCRHRLEHVEMPAAEDLRLLADAGVVASVQPAFDAAWGGATGMYAERLGPARAAALNPFADMTAKGVVLAFGSDAPVTPLDPWATVRAASEHRHVDQRISVRAAFAAHTRGGRRASRDELHEPGTIMIDAPATYAVWAPGPLTVQAPDGRVAAWSTDPRSGTPPLPDLAEVTPTCWRTVRAGTVIFDSGALDTMVTS
jgi:predicted amidohydrolase YtcJ